uniref:Putative secreted protein n=1 Tax=Panstrongylus lignarius TaxID=156445 RepID=A0A224XSR5_9HEMI
MLSIFFLTGTCILDNPLLSLFLRLALSLSSSNSLSQFTCGNGDGTHSCAIYFFASYFALINDSNAESVCGRLKVSGRLAS